MSDGPGKRPSCELERQLAEVLELRERAAADEKAIIDDGSTARAAGRSIYSNPHVFGTRGFDWWRRGWYRRAIGGQG